MRVLELEDGDVVARGEEVPGRGGRHRALRRDGHEGGSCNVRIVRILQVT